MTRYTVETLKKENYCFDNEYSITESDVMKVNKIINMIENSRSTERVQVGDVVQYTNEYGKYYPHAMITNLNNDTEFARMGFRNAKSPVMAYDGDFTYLVLPVNINSIDINGNDVEERINKLMKVA